MPEPHRPSDRTAAERQADHAGLARLSDTLVPALVQKLTGSGLGELEVREGDWRVRLRRPTGALATARRERPRTGSHGPSRPAPAGTTPAPRDPHRAAATSPAVGVFRTVVGVGHRVRQGDRIAVVDLLGIPQDVVAPIDGIVVELIAETGDPVEYGEEVAIVAEPLPEPAATDDHDADRGDGTHGAGSDASGGLPGSSGASGSNGATGDSPDGEG
jgi:acetyl-CoA carboxylase biotin carboxyl carrier protein